MYSVEEVLDHYGIEHEPSHERGEELYLCPFHDDVHLGSASFNLAKEVFECFSCGAGGNLIQFVAKLEGSTNREAAVLIENDFVEGQVYDLDAYQKLYRVPQDQGPADPRSRVMIEAFTRVIVRGLGAMPFDRTAYWLAICSWAYCPGIPQSKALLRHLDMVCQDFLKSQM